MSRPGCDRHCEGIRDQRRADEVIDGGAAKEAARRADEVIE